MSHHQTAAATSATVADDRIIAVSRLFDAPPEAVFKAFTDPAMMAQWWAPEPLTVPRAESDLRVGGRYTYVMRDPDGNDYPSTGVYREIVEPTRLVLTDSMAEMPSSWLDTLNEARGAEKGTPIPDGVVTVTFEDAGDGRTKVTFSEEFDSAAIRDAFVHVQMIEGLNGSYDNLEKLLARTS